MPLYWTIDSWDCLFTVRAEGTVTSGDVLGFFDAASGACALTYRKLIDGRAGTWALTDEEILIIAPSPLLPRPRPHGCPGPGLDPSADLAAAHLLGVFAAADRPTKVFASPRQARRWIDGRRDATASLEAPVPPAA